jgi:hydroxymethylpyrimidine/phosphomethylpyrimidine kinase
MGRETRRERHVSTVVALSIAGSDPSGGAGIQADLKTFSALGVYGTAVITALTAQNTLGVTGVHPVPADVVLQQLETLVYDVRVDAVKIGMLANGEIAEVVAEFLRRRTFDLVVLDPVMVATSGDRLLAHEGIDAIRRLLPLASIVTPNLSEASALLDTPLADDVDAMRRQAVAIHEKWGPRVLVKGGHLTAERAAVDVFAGPEGEITLSAPWVRTRSTHGTGCALSSALAALRPQRPDWPSTVRDAKNWLAGALDAADGIEVGRGHGPVHHLYDLWAARR